MNAGVPLDNLYFEWLCDRIEYKPRFMSQLRELYSIPFEFFVPNDQNRAMDGLDLRDRFLTENRLEGPDWFELECSMLEMLVALSDRVSFETGGTTRFWFWNFFYILELNDESVSVKNVMRRINRRTYHRNGKGGLFPLKHPQQDQREVEIWYQMSAYLLENNFA